MPIEKTEMEGDWQLDHFEKTPKMPTYLLAFVVCDFKGKTVTSKRGTNVSDWYCVYFEEIRCALFSVWSIVLKEKETTLLHKITETENSVESHQAA